MATCRNCGQESLRIKTTWHEYGEPTDECSACCPQSFDSKVTDPSDKKIWMGYEAHPNEYVKAEDGGYDRKPEYRAEQEERLRNETEEERTNRLAAEARKRRTRRTVPLNGVELAQALRKAEKVASFIVAAAEQGRDVN